MAFNLTLLVNIQFLNASRYSDLPPNAIPGQMQFPIIPGGVSLGASG